MKYLIPLLIVLLTGCNPQSNSAPAYRVLSYDELYNYPVQCERATEQLAELYNVQRIKNFDPDPDKLDESDNAYNSRLKATIWWFAYRCEK